MQVVKKRTGNKIFEQQWQRKKYKKLFEQEKQLSLHVLLITLSRKEKVKVAKKNRFASYCLCDIA